MKTFPIWFGRREGKTSGLATYSRENSRCFVRASFAQMLIVLLLLTLPASAADRSLRANPELARYFEADVARIEEQQSLLNYSTLAEWEQAKPKLRSQLFDMLGMSPQPDRTALNPRVLGVIEEDDFVVERLHFESMPGLYVTANFYRPKQVDNPLPTVLYVCGHAVVRDGEVSFGNKVAYQHHESVVC